MKNNWLKYIVTAFLITGLASCALGTNRAKKANPCNCPGTGSKKSKGFGY